VAKTTSLKPSPSGKLSATDAKLNSALVTFSDASGKKLNGVIVLVAYPEMKCCGRKPEQDGLTIAEHKSGGVAVDHLFFGKAGEWLLNVQYCAQGKPVMGQVEFPVKSK